MTDSLTAREQTVCDHVVAGLRTKEIARALKISPRTVETHRKRVYEKLGVRNAIELTRLVLIGATGNG